MIDIEGTFLPNGRMRQIQRVTGLTDSSITGEVDVGPDHWVYPNHFPGDPVFPAVLIIEAAGQLVALWAWAQGQRGRPRLVRTSARFRHSICPESQRIELRATVRVRRGLSFADVRVWSSNLEAARVETILAVLPNEQ